MSALCAISPGSGFAFLNLTRYKIAQTSGKHLGLFLIDFDV
jgi:hypothetical protein